MSNDIKKSKTNRLKSVGEKTSPKTAGEKNMVGMKIHGNRKADDNKIADLSLILKIKDDRKKYIEDNGKVYYNSDKREWTPEELSDAIEGFFRWCVDYYVCPSVPLLSIWLQCSKKTVWEWEHKDTEIGDVVRTAMNAMEAIYWNDLDHNFKSNQYRLHTKLGKDYSDKKQIEVKSNDLVVSEEELLAAVDKLLVDED